MENAQNPQNDWQDWHELVYGKKDKTWTDRFEDELLADGWDKIRRIIIRRDHQKCRRCNKQIPYSEVTIHHIKPRSEGGSYLEKNLISLCPSCHDFVECHNPPLRSIAAIEGSMPVEMSYTEILYDEFDDENRPSWHKWVYGGGKNPNL